VEGIVSDPDKGAISGKQEEGDITLPGKWVSISVE